MTRPIALLRPVVPLVVLVVASTASALAQHTPDVNPPSAQHQHGSPSVASELFPAREASGTAWLPHETPTYGVPHTWGKWEVMLHGTAFGQFIYEPGEKHRTGGFSSRQVSSVNWLMAMARPRVGAGRVGLRTMASGEPWTVRDCGFINLLASGEMCEGDTIHDRQHPHDLFMELAADYDRPLRGSLRWQVYAGLAGEPALGPAGFPHRLSALPNPIAPITHHWLDSSHITFGLITTGLYQARWKAEVGDAVTLVTHAVLLESNFTIRERHTWFARIEVVGKTGHDLHAHEAPVTVFGVGKVQGGYVRYLNPWNGVVPGIGGTVSVSIVPPALAPRYSGRLAPGFGAFLTLRPARHLM